jgi:predicted DNA-binding transcriptional regulator AlpA
MRSQTSSLHLDAARAAAWVGLSASTLAKLRLKGTGPAYLKLGRRVVYRIDDLEDWIQAHRCKSTSEYSERVQREILPAHANGGPRS